MFHQSSNLLDSLLSSSATFLHPSFLLAAAECCRIRTCSAARADLKQTFFYDLVYYQPPGRQFEQGLFLSVRASRPAPTSSSLSCQSGDQWTHPPCSRESSFSRRQPLTNLRALSKKRPGVCVLRCPLSRGLLLKSFLPTAGCMFQSLPPRCPSQWPTVCRLTVPTAPLCSVSAPTPCSTTRTPSTAQGLTALLFY